MSGGLPMLSGLFGFVGRHATRFMFGGVLVGLALPWLADLVRPLFVPLLLIPLTIALMRLDWQAFKAYGRRPLLILAILGFLLLLCPVLMLAALQPFGLPPALSAAIVLMAAAPPIVSAAAISLILGLDAALAVIVIVLSTALVPLTLPPVALLLLGIQIEMSLPEFMGRLALLVGSAFLAALILRKAIRPAWLQANGQLFDGVSVTVLVLFAVAIMAGVTEKMLSHPGYVALTTLAAFIANLALQALGYGAGRVVFRLGRPAAATLGLLTGNCNMGLVMVALADKAEFDMVVFFAMGQLPMYMLPGLLYPLYKKLAQTPE
jgi:BASS family bile acid:Na+ symporter